MIEKETDLYLLVGLLVVGLVVGHRYGQLPTDSSSQYTLSSRPQTSSSDSSTTRSEIDRLPSVIQKRPEPSDTRETKKDTRPSSPEPSRSQSNPFKTEKGDTLTKLQLRGIIDAGNPEDRLAILEYDREEVKLGSPGETLWGVRLVGGDSQSVLVEQAGDTRRLILEQ